MLTLDMLTAMEPDTIFVRGEIVDGPFGLNMTGGGQQLRWVAVRGGAPDWAIYCDWAHHDWEDIRRNGDKVSYRNVATIRRLVPCDDAALDRYRP